MRSRRLLPAIATIAIRLRLLWLILIAFFLLSGCVRSDIDIRFQDANHGSIVQHIRIAEGSTGLENTIATAWLDNLAQQTEKLGGTLRRTTQQEARLTLPFFNAKDLEAKFNQLLQTELQPSQERSGGTAQTPIVSQLKMRSGNWLLWQRIVLDYELDLQSLTPFTQESLAIDPSKLLQLSLSLTTPSPAQSSDAAAALRSKGRKLVWQLRPGQLNHLQAIFWVPSPLGRGAALIAALILVSAIAKSSLRDLQTDLPVH